VCGGAREARERHAPARTENISAGQRRDRNPGRGQDGGEAVVRGKKGGRVSPQTTCRLQSVLVSKLQHLTPQFSRHLR